jgi:hypothetical protein
MPVVTLRRSAALSGIRPGVATLATDHPLAHKLVYAMLDPVSGYDHVRGAGVTSRVTNTRTAAPMVGEALNLAGATLTAHVSQFSGLSAQRTWAVWVQRTGAGGSSVGRILGSQSGSTGAELVRWNSTASTLSYGHGFSLGNGLWGVAFTTGEMRLVVVTYDNSASTNDPTFDVNGVSVTPTEHSTPSGTTNVSAGAFHFFGYSGSGLEWQGVGGPVLCWDRILNPAERWSLYDPATRWDLWRQPSARLWFNITPAGGNRRRRVLMRAA